jgi:hypothetical protein
MKMTPENKNLIRVTFTIRSRITDTGKVWEEVCADTHNAKEYYRVENIHRVEGSVHLMRFASYFYPIEIPGIESSFFIGDGLLGNGMVLSFGEWRLTVLIKDEGYCFHLCDLEHVNLVSGIFHHQICRGV